FLDELIPVKYYLEVSSPGLERKFKSDKEFVIFKGKRISIKLKEPLEGEVEKIFKGEILDFDETEGLRFFRFDDGQELLIPRANIQSAKLYID
uniref:ribosome maturation factor RimP n=1 Tax=Candidatus Scatousia sp. TaxID=3085663 RepID=UPI004025C2E5